MESIIFGAGNYGEFLMRGLEKYYGVHICAICDNDERKWGGAINNVKIISPQELIEMSFDKIFVCIRDEFKAVETQLINMEIPKDKIVIMRISREYQDAFIEADPVRKNWIKAFSEYIYEEGMVGNVAECGVYDGNTAMFINKYWPDRTLYLFDSFEGFSDKDIAHELNSFSTFKDTLSMYKNSASDDLLKIVKGRMCHLENVKIYKGYFPECAGVIEDKFCFVNLDMDLYQPQIDGLRYFWDKMVMGGIILLHDYYNPEFPGVKAAVTDYEIELGQKLLKFPIGDSHSIAIIKPY